MDRPMVEPDAAPAALYAVIDGRRSIRAYRPEAVPREVVERLLRAAAMAPSAHNRQPWRFVWLSDAALARRLAEAMGERLAEDRRRDGDAADSIARDVARSCARLTGAPDLLLVCAAFEDMDVYPDARRQQAEMTMAVQSAAMAAQNLMLAAAAEGLATCWMCAPLFCPDAIRQVLTLPSTWQPQGLITLGYPAAPGKRRGRKPLDEVVIEKRPF